MTVDEAIKLNDKYTSSGLTQKAFALTEGISKYRVNLFRHIIKNQKPGTRLPTSSIAFTQIKQPGIQKKSKAQRSGVNIGIGEFTVGLEHAFDRDVLCTVISILHKELADV
jgi:hypothetical protein